MRAVTTSLLLLLSCADEARALDPAPAAAANAARLKVFASGLSQPVALACAPGEPGRIYVVEKTGRIRSFVNGTREPAPLLDLSGRVSLASEQGLLGLVFHPKYAENHKFYVNLTDKAGDTRVLEYRVKAGVADATTERELLFVDQPYANHNGGHVAFGPDGKLWVGLGDGGAGNDPHGNGQSKTALLAKMLRVDVDTVPAPPAEIHMRGLRNPWRYAFDRATGDLFIADVGQDKWEEIDVVPAAQALSGGQNFGWNTVEGNGHCLRGTSCAQDGLTQPLVEYNHKTGCSITGGFVYRGKRLPALDGIYFYSDYCTAILRGFRYKGGKVADHWDWKRALDPDNKVSQVSSFGEDAEGELYVLSLEGTVWKLSARE